MSTDVIGIAILVLCGLLLGTAALGILWVVVSGLVSLLQDLLAQLGRERSRLPRGRSVQALPGAPWADEFSPTVLSDVSTEAMWHRMQGTSKRARSRRPSGPVSHDSR